MVMTLDRDFKDLLFPLILISALTLGKELDDYQPTFQMRPAPI